MKIEPSNPSAGWEFRAVDEHDRICRLCSAFMDLLKLFRRVQRRFHPMMIRKHKQALAERSVPLRKAVDEAPSRDADSGGDPVEDVLIKASMLLLQAVELFILSDEEVKGAVFCALKAMRKVCQAEEVIFELRRYLSEINEYFLEEPQRDGEMRNEISMTMQFNDHIIHESVEHDPYARGVLSFYVPDLSTGQGRRMLVVALHGGFGHGRDFLWTWIREARTRGFFLLAPTSQGRTWSIEDPEHDIRHLMDSIEKLAQEYPLDREKILLTGISDGGTFALRTALCRKTPFSGFSAVSGVLPYADMTYVGSRRIFIIHGRYDWMFPVERAKLANDVLRENGADVRLKIIEDLAHAYPYEENSTILSWFNQEGCGG